MSELATLRAAHPSFGPVADTLVDLANDDTVSPQVYLRVCEAVFTVLNAWAESRIADAFTPPDPFSRKV